MRPFLEKLQATADAQGRAETAYRDESRRRLHELATLRTRAYRRYNLLKDMADLAESQSTAEDSIRLQTALATEETGWAEGADGYGDVRERLGAVAGLIHAEVHDDAANSHEAQPHTGTVDDVFGDFEAWHRKRFGEEFLDRIRRETPFYPVVDF